MPERDFGREAHDAAEAHLEAVYYAEFEEGGGDSPAMGPFCGCSTCVVREILHAAWPILLEAARAEVAG